MERVSHRICPLCEACCGLEITTLGDQVVAIRGHKADVLSAGFLCPKGAALGELHADPDRIRRPLLKRDGAFVEVHLDIALEAAEARDVKGLYAKARRGELAHFTGIDSPYEAPERPELHIDAAGITAQDAADAVVQRLRELRRLR